MALQNALKYVRVQVFFFFFSLTGEQKLVWNRKPSFIRLFFHSSSVRGSFILVRVAVHPESLGMLGIHPGSDTHPLLIAHSHLVQLARFEEAGGNRRSQSKPQWTREEDEKLHSDGFVEHEMELRGREASTLRPETSIIIILIVI